MKGFKHTGNGPKSGHHFSSKSGFSHSGTRKQDVRGYTRNTPKPKFAEGGSVARRANSDLTSRSQPVSQFDKDHGGKTPLRPGFNKGGKACYAEGGKVNSMGAAIRMVKELVKRGDSHEAAARKAATRYGVSPGAVTGNVKPSGPATGGDPQLLAKGGRPLPTGPLKAPPAATLTGRAPPMRIPSPVTRGVGSFRRGPIIR